MEESAPQPPPTRKKINPREILIWIGILACSAVIAYSMSGSHDHSHDHLVGQPIPSIKLKATDGALIDLAAQSPRTIVLNVYATWCPPCKAEIPDLARFAKAKADAGAPVDVYGVVFESGPPHQAQRDSASMGITYPILMGNDTVARHFELHTYPTTLIINSEGVLTHRHEGIITERQLALMIP